MALLHCRSPDWMEQGLPNKWWSERDCFSLWLLQHRILLAFFAGSLCSCFMSTKASRSFSTELLPTTLPACIVAPASSFPSEGLDICPCWNFVKFVLDKLLSYYYLTNFLLSSQPLIQTVVSHLGYKNTARQGVKSFAKVKVLPCIHKFRQLVIEGNQIGQAVGNFMLTLAAFTMNLGKEHDPKPGDGGGPIWAPTQLWMFL